MVNHADILKSFNNLNARFFININKFRLLAFQLCAIIQRRYCEIADDGVRRIFAEFRRIQLSLGTLVGGYSLGSLHRIGKL